MRTEHKTWDHPDGQRCLESKSNRGHNVVFMNKICAAQRDLQILERLNAVRLWLHVSRLSDIAHIKGTQIENWVIYEPPAVTTISWPKRRKPLEETVKLWQDTIRSKFCGTLGIYPSPLGSPLVLRKAQELLQPDVSVDTIIGHYPTCYRAVLGISVLGYSQVTHIIWLMKDGNLYAGSDESVKDKIGSHTYAFTNGIEEGIIRVGAAITPESPEKMSFLRAQRGGGQFGFF